MVDILSKIRSEKKPRIFQSLSEESLSALLSRCFLRSLPANNLIVQQGETPSHMYLVVEGNLRTFRTDEDGHEATIRMLQPGSTCMEAAIFMGGSSPVNVQTVTAAKVLFIPGKSVKAQVLADSAFAANLLRIVSSHYKEALHQIETMSMKPPLQRIGYYFLQRHIEQGHGNLDFTLAFQKQQISNYLGITPETFSRALNRMKGMGIDADNQTITLRDAFSLCRFCDSDTADICPKQGSPDCTFCSTH